MEARKCGHGEPCYCDKTDAKPVEMCGHCGRFEVGEDRICRSCIPKPKPKTTRKIPFFGTIMAIAFLTGIPDANQDPKGE
jgi:hypothetical protein